LYFLALTVVEAPDFVHVTPFEIGAAVAGEAVSTPEAMMIVTPTAASLRM
jgi:hypothetical protein